jgi:O-acetylhomoserine (thiol)-lyase
LYARISSIEVLFEPSVVNYKEVCYFLNYNLNRMNQQKRNTICVQGGWQPKTGEARVLPIYQSTTFKYASSDEMGQLFDLEKSGYFYTRLQNPTNDCVAAKIAALEGGIAAMLTSSGQAASFYSIFNLCENGDHFVCTSEIYGGTFNLFAVTMKKMGVEVTFVNQNDPEEELDKAFRPNTKAVFGETIANPAGAVLDIEKFAHLAHKHHVPLIIDNTFPTPINCRPFEWGADIVIHSTTKYMDGHATSVGGAIVDSGNFDWEAYPDKFPGLTTPDESYHGIAYSKKFGKLAYITKATVQMMRDLGSIQSPQNAFLTNIGLETLHLRMPRHCENAQKMAEYLSTHPQVAWVQYCGLPEDKYHTLAQKYLPNGSCGVLTFGIKGGRDNSIRFMDSLKLVAIVTHVSDARSCVLHPASHTHRQLSDEQLIAAGVKPDLIRFSVGIEDIEDLIADVQQALENI